MNSFTTLSDENNAVVLEPYKQQLAANKSFPYCPINLLSSFFQIPTIVPTEKLEPIIELPSRGSNVTMYGALASPN